MPEKKILREWQTPVGFKSSTNDGSCMAVQTYMDGSVDIKSTVTGGLVTLTAMEWEAARLAIQDGQYDTKA